LLFPAAAIVTLKIALADLFERVGVAVADAVAELDDLALAVGQGLEHGLDAVEQHLTAGTGDRRFGIARPR
jgi:hypothetical protein